MTVFGTERVVFLCALIHDIVGLLYIYPTDPVCISLSSSN